MSDINQRLMCMKTHRANDENEEEEKWKVKIKFMRLIALSCFHQMRVCQFNSFTIENRPIAEISVQSEFIPYKLKIV